VTEAVRSAFEWVYKIAITLIVAVVVVAIVGNTMKSDLNTASIQKQLLLNRILYAPDSIWYVDASGVVYPGIVDFSQFTQAHLDSTFQYPDNYGGAKLTLHGSGQETTVFIAEKNFKYYELNANRGIKQGGTVEVHTYPVLIHESNVEYNGYLSVTIAMPERT
jgi:hypothetical protein